MKRLRIGYRFINYIVAPFTGAWIETIFLARINTLSDSSHPSRVRGLKQKIS